MTELEVFEGFSFPDHLGEKIGPQSDPRAHSMKSHVLASPEVSPAPCFHEPTAFSAISIYDLDV